MRSAPWWQRKAFIVAGCVLGVVGGVAIAVEFVVILLQLRGLH